MTKSDSRYIDDKAVDYSFIALPCTSYSYSLWHSRAPPLGKPTNPTFQRRNRSARCRLRYGGTVREVCCTYCTYCTLYVLVVRKYFRTYVRLRGLVPVMTAVADHADHNSTFSSSLLDILP